MISIIIPTLNSENVIEQCLSSIRNQDFPQNKVKILIVDGGSIDQTLAIAAKYHCQIFSNPRKTAEAGKAIGLAKTHYRYTAFIDSDNILPTNDWLNQMLLPLETDKTLIGSEPWEFTYRSHGGFIERYSALIGANDPYAYITGISDRRNFIDYLWTTMKLAQKDYSSYLKIKLEPHQPIPTIGANGTIFRTEFLQSNFHSDYLFDIDVITQILNSTQKPIYFAKTKNGIIHTYCESSIPKFYRKQMRRLKDYYQFKSLRHFDYKNNLNLNPLHNFLILAHNNLKFVLYTVTIIPMFITLIRGYLHKPDVAWLFHPLACVITLYCYIFVSLSFLFGFNTEQSRQTWSQ